MRLYRYINREKWMFFLNFLKTQSLQLTKRILQAKAGTLLGMGAAFLGIALAALGHWSAGTGLPSLVLHVQTISSPSATGSAGFPLPSVVAGSVEVEDPPVAPDPPSVADDEPSEEPPLTDDPSVDCPVVALPPLAGVVDTDPSGNEVDDEPSVVFVVVVDPSG